ncbi:MAG: NAD(P)H-dependent oxidoreductase [Rhizobiaceae bacterium]
MAKALVVLAHPNQRSLTAHFAERAAAALRDAGHDVDWLDLAAAGFEPRLSADERAAYYRQPPDPPAAFDEARRLAQAEILVLAFPVWWSLPPALLVGFFDRVFAPGVAFDHGRDFGPLVPRLGRLRQVVAIAAFGSPWFFDRIIMRRPLRRILRTGLIKACAPRARFDWLAFASAENPPAARVAAFEARIARLLAHAGA